MAKQLSTAWPGHPGAFGLQVRECIRYLRVSVEAPFRGMDRTYDPSKAKGFSPGPAGVAAASCSQAEAHEPSLPGALQNEAAITTRPA